MMELGPPGPRIDVGPLINGIGVFGGLVAGNPTAREVKPLTPTTGVRMVEEICAAAPTCPLLDRTVDANGMGRPLARTLDMMTAASEVRTFPNAGVDDSMLTLAGTPTAEMVGKTGMTIDVGKLGGDVSTGPGTVKIGLLGISPFVAEISGFEEKP